MIGNKGICDKGFIWNLSNCDCECDKLCDIGEYLDYKNCKCRKKLVDELVEEFSKNIDGKEMIYNKNWNYYKNLFNILKKEIFVFDLILILKQQSIRYSNGKYQTN